MASYVETPTRSDTAAGAIAQHLRVKTPGALVVATENDVATGTMEFPCLAAGPCTVRLRSAQGTKKMVAVDAITKGNPVYAAAAGKISAAGTVREGVALEASTANNDVIEVMDAPHVDLVAAGGITLPTVTFNGTTTANNLVMPTNLADALSIRDTGDLIVFRTSTGSQSITITPATTITGALTLTSALTVGTTLGVTSLSTLTGGTVLPDNAQLRLGSGAGGDVVVKWNATYLEATSLTNPMWAACPSPLDPNFASVAYEVFDDFTTLDPTATVGNWPETVVGSGTQAISDTVAGGVLALTCQGTTDDACEQCTYVSAPFKLVAGKTLWYETRIKITGDVESEHSFGLVNLGEDLTAVADVFPQDGICFSTQDGSLALALTCSKNGTNTGAVAAVHTLVTGTWVVLGFLIDGVTSVTPYVNGVAGTAATATLCDDELLAPYFLVRNGDATTQQILEIDYVKVIQLR